MPTPTPTATNTSGLIYLTGQMSLPANLTVGMVVTDSSGNCWEIIATTGSTPDLTWGNQIFPVGGCASCLVVNPCPTLTPTTTPTPTPTPGTCQAYNIQVGTGVSGCTFTYTDCSGVTQTVTITSGMSNTVCALLPPTTSCGASAYTITNIGNCCQSYYIQVGSGVSGCTFSYIDCSGNTQSVTITSGNTNILCSLTTPTTSCGTSAYTMTNQGFCCQTYNINVNSTTTGCTFSYINCSGFNQTVTIVSGLPLSVCSIITPTTTCPTSAYTMTMSGSCCSYYNLSVINTSCTFNYIDCSGNSQSVVVTSASSTNVCSLVTPTTSCNPTGYTITSASTCNPCVTYTLTNNNSVPYTFSYVDCSGVTQTVTLSPTGGTAVICTLSVPVVVKNVTIVASGNCNPSTCYYIGLQPSVAGCYIDYTDVTSGFTTIFVSSATTVQVCSTTLPAVSSLSAICSPSDVVIIAGSGCTYNVTGSTWDCPTVQCKCWDIYVEAPTNCTVNYVDCDGIIQFYPLSGGTTGNTVCSPYQPDLTSCGVTYTATTSGDCAIAISGVYECVPCYSGCNLGYTLISGEIQFYDFTNNTCNPIATSVFVDDIAGTDNYVWTVAGTSIDEYPWTECPLSFSGVSRTITLTGFTGTVKGFTSIANNTLLAVDSGSNILYELLITTTTAVQTNSFSLPVGRVFDGDIVYTIGNQIITITSGASGYYVTQINRGTGLITADVIWTASSQPVSFLYDSGNLYVTDLVNDVYQLSTTYPYNQTYVQTLPCVFVASATYGRYCANTELLCSGDTCAPWYWIGSTPYLYDFTANTVTDESSIFISGLTASEGAGISDNYFYTFGTSTPGFVKIKEFPMVCNYQAYAPTEYSLSGYPASNYNLAAYSDNVVFYVYKSGTTYQLIYAQLDPINSTGSTTSYLTLSTNQPNRDFDYDLEYNYNNQKLLIINRENVSPFNYYLTQINTTNGNVDVDVNLSGATTVIAPRSIFVDSGNLYITLQNGDVYNVGLSSPYTLTYIQNIGITITNGAQRPICVNALLT